MNAPTPDLFQNPEAEREILSTLLNEPDTIHTLSLKPEHFYSPKHQLIFSHCRKIADSLSLPAVIDSLKQSGELEKTGGAVYLADLMTAFLSAATIQTAQRIIKENWQRREMLTRFYKSIQRITTDSPAEILTDLQNFESQTTPGGFKHVRDISSDFLQDISNIYENQRPAGLQTGLIDLDNKIGGLRPGQVAIIGARPAVGKSALALTIALNQIVKNIPVGLISLEMTGKENVSRLACMHGKINSDVLKGAMTNNQFKRLNAATIAINGLPLFIDDSTAGDIDQALANARVSARKNKIELLIIDYLQLFGIGNGSDTRNNELTTISRKIKQFALSEKIPVIALAQLNRNADGRMPGLADLRDSGAIEQDADIVGLLHRPEEGQAVIFNLAKNRNGQTAIFKLLFQAEYTLFQNYSDAPF